MPAQVQSANKKQGFFYGYVIVIAAFMIMAIAYSTFYTYGVFFKPVSADFGWSRAMMSGPFSLNNFLYGVFCIIAGRLTDRFGPRLLITSCGILLGLGYFFLSQLSSIWQLYLLHGVVIAIGMSGGIVPLSSTIGKWFVEKRGLMMGIFMAGLGVGSMVGPSLASVLISTYEWRNSFIILGIIVFVFIVLAAQFIRRDPAQKGLFPYGSTNRNPAIKQRYDSATASVNINTALRTRQFWILLILNICRLLCLMVVMVHIFQYATDIGINNMVAAIIMGAIGFATILGQVFMGVIADRIGNKFSMIISYGSSALALLWLLIARDPWSLLLFAAVFGFGNGGMATSLPLITAELFGLSSYGVIFGVIMFGGCIGGTIGPVMGGYIFDISGNYNLVFIIMAVIAIISLLLTLLIKKTPKVNEQHFS